MPSIVTSREIPSINLRTQRPIHQAKDIRCYDGRNKRLEVGEEKEVTRGYNQILNLRSAHLVGELRFNLTLLGSLLGLNGGLLTHGGKDNDV